MKIRLLYAIFSVVFLSDYVYSEEVSEIKKGDFPYMAFIYYSHDNVLDVTGNRFLRGAILIRPDWLVSSAIQTSSNEKENLFPRKTLLARLGTTSIDTKFTLNEDDDEQEREVIKIVRPSNHSATQWWQADITLMHTLLPFKINSVVSPASLHSGEDPIAKSCTILVYVKRHVNQPENRILMQLPVELLSPSIETCGIHFYESTMTCASDRDDNKDVVYDPNFCQGNNGGPLICEGKVIGLQTYIDNNCKPPHLYQLLAVWRKLILCGTEDKCADTQCANTCIVTNKDPDTTSARPTIYWEERMTNTTGSIAEVVEFSPTLTTITTNKEISMTTEGILTTIHEFVMTTQNNFTIREDNVTTEENVEVMTHTPITELITSQRPTRTAAPTSEIVLLISDETPEMHENEVLYRKKGIENEQDLDEEKILNNNIEDQLEDKGENKKKQRTLTRSAAGRNTSVIQRFFVACILASFV